MLPVTQLEEDILDRSVCKIREAFRSLRVDFYGANFFLPGMSGIFADHENSNNR